MKPTAHTTPWEFYLSESNKLVCVKHGDTANLPSSLIKERPGKALARKQPP